LKAEKIPRLVIAGLSGDSAKTIVTLSLLTAFRQRGLKTSVFKKGPDYIDPAWLSLCAKSTCRNLDTFLVDSEDVVQTFIKGSVDSEIAIIEGNRGIFDGKDVCGTHSTAGLAKLLRAPVVLVVNCVKSTRTIAAIVKGCIDFDPDLNIAGVILNKVAGKRHEKIITESIEKYCGIKVLGAIPNLGVDSDIIPGRHLGLVTPSEYNGDDKLTLKLKDLAKNYLKIENIIKIANNVDSIDTEIAAISKFSKPNVKIGYFKDPVFTFYYPENLESLEREGAELVPISSINDKVLPDIDGLYIGGGFPETQAKKLVENKSMMISLKNAADSGLPIYAECGGLIYLSNSLTWHNKTYDMAGVFPIDLIMNEKPVGHGYVEGEITRPNPFFEIGTLFKGHEFHYTGLMDYRNDLDPCIKLSTGRGLGNRTDGLLYNNCMACYCHIHANGMKDWAANFLAMTRENKNHVNPSLNKTIINNNEVSKTT
jgi:cobyrinic acid a,c-diamide synthase